MPTESASPSSWDDPVVPLAAQQLLRAEDAITLRSPRAICRSTLRHRVQSARLEHRRRGRVFCTHQSSRTSDPCGRSVAFAGTSATACAQHGQQGVRTDSRWVDATSLRSRCRQLGVVVPVALDVQRRASRPAGPISRRGGHCDPSQRSGWAPSCPRSWLQADRDGLGNSAWRTMRLTPITSVSSRLMKVSPSHKRRPGHAWSSQERTQ